MRVIAELLMLTGGLVALIAGAGLLKFSTPFARFHSAGKASPVAFLISALGASLVLGWGGAAALAVASAAMVLTLPLGVHLLFRAVHQTGDISHMKTDELRARR